MQMRKEDYQIMTMGFAKAVKFLLKGHTIVLYTLSNDEYIEELIELDDIHIDYYVDVSICKQVARYLARCIKCMEDKYTNTVSLRILTKK